MYSNSRQKKHLIEFTLHRTASRNWATQAVIYTLGRFTVDSATQWGNKIHMSSMLWGKQIKSFCHSDGDVDADYRPKTIMCLLA